MPPLLSKEDLSKKWTCQNIPGAASLNSPYGFNRAHNCLWTTSAGLSGALLTNIFFPKNYDLLENSFYSHANYSKVFTAKFCTSHTSKTPVTCAKIYRGLLDWNGTLLKKTFHKTWILREMSLVKLTPSRYSSGWTPQATEEMGKLSGYYSKNCRIWMAHRSLWYALKPNHSIYMKWGDSNEEHVEMFYKWFVNVLYTIVHSKNTTKQNFGNSVCYKYNVLCIYSWYIKIIFMLIWVYNSTLWMSYLD